MGINATLIGQFGTFLVFILFTMKFVWPHITQAMSERRTKIADGLAAAEKGVRDLEEAESKAQEMLREAREQAADLIAQANKRGLSIVEEAKVQAKEEQGRIIEDGHARVEQERNRLRESLRAEVAGIAVAGAGRILEREIDARTHKDLLDSLAAEL